MITPLLTDQTQLRALCRRHHIRSLRLFGSTLEGTAGPQSDIDLLVEFEPGRKPGYVRLAEIEMEIAAMLGGRRVDLRTEGELSRHFRNGVIAESRLEYTA